jgi:hypothetical protein
VEAELAGFELLREEDFHLCLHALPANIFSLVILRITLSLELAGQVDRLLLYRRLLLVEAVEADVLAGGSFELLGVVGSRTLLGRVFVILQVEVVLLLGLLASAFVVVENGGVELIHLLVLLVCSFQPIQQILKVLVVLHPLLGLDEALLEALLLVVILEGPMLLFVWEGSHLGEFFLPHDALEPALQLFDPGEQQFFLPFEDGHVLVVKVHFVVLQEDLQLIHLLFALSIHFWCLGDHLFLLVHLLP